MPEELIELKVRRGWVAATYWTCAGESVKQIPLATDDSRCRQLAEELRQLARFIESGGAIPDGQHTC